MTVTAPEGYDLLDTNNVISIDDNTKTVKVSVVKKVVEPEAPKSRWIRVEFINAAGAVVATDRQDVEFGRLSMTVTAPEGYDLLDTNNVLSIDDNTKTVKVSVVKKAVEPEAPKSRWIRVEYINAAGAIVATERQNVEFGRLTMCVKAPEGYTLADTNNVLSISDETKTVKVSVLKAAAEPEVKPSEKPEVKPSEKPEAKPEAEPAQTAAPASSAAPAAKLPQTQGVSWTPVLLLAVAGLALTAAGLMGKKRSRG